MPELAQLVSDGLLLYLVVAGLVMADAVFPLAPSESLLVAGGVLAASGEVALLPLIAAGTVGALTGHLILYSLGSSAGPRVKRRLLRSRKNEEKAEKIGGQLNDRPWLLVVADFVPWGRTILMFTAGAFGVARRRFLGFAAMGAVIWATAFSLLGFLGGNVFESPWHGLAASLAVVLAIGGIGELIRRRRSRGTRTEVPAGEHVNVQTGREPEAEIKGQAMLASTIRSSTD